MTDYTKLIEALRCDLIRVHCKHDECQYYTKDGWCNDRTMATDAANAIEELVAENERLNSIIDVFITEDAE